MHSNRWAGWLGALVLTATVGAAAISRSEAVEARPAGAGAWEYRVILVSDLVPDQGAPAAQVTALESKLNTLGRDGWELSQQMQRVMVFKRPTK
jgi:hypothetical protein